MSRNEQRIRKALEAKGYIVRQVYWQPLGPHFEKSGQDGGWTVLFAEPDSYTDYLGGYNIGFVMEWIESLPDVRGEAAS